MCEGACGSGELKKFNLPDLDMDSLFRTFQTNWIATRFFKLYVATQQTLVASIFMICLRSTELIPYY
jgi:hypothetical protein